MSRCGNSFCVITQFLSAKADLLPVVAVDEFSPLVAIFEIACVKQQAKWIPQEVVPRLEGEMPAGFAESNWFAMGITVHFRHEFQTWQNLVHR